MMVGQIVHFQIFSICSRKAAYREKIELRLFGRNFIQRNETDASIVI